jgi:hypothetical protein
MNAKGTAYTTGGISRTWAPVLTSTTLGRRAGAIRGRRLG